MEIMFPWTMHRGHDKISIINIALLGGQGTFVLCHCKFFGAKFDEEIFHALVEKKEILTPTHFFEAGLRVEGMDVINFFILA